MSWFSGTQRNDDFSVCVALGTGSLIAAFFVSSSKSVDRFSSGSVNLLIPAPRASLLLNWPPVPSSSACSSRTISFVLLWSNSEGFVPKSVLPDTAPLPGVPLPVLLLLLGPNGDPKVFDLYPGEFLANGDPASSELWRSGFLTNPLRTELMPAGSTLVGKDSLLVRILGRPEVGGVDDDSEDVLAGVTGPENSSTEEGEEKSALLLVCQDDLDREEGEGSLASCDRVRGGVRFSWLDMVDT